MKTGTQETADTGFEKGWDFPRLLVLSPKNKELKPLY